MLRVLTIILFGLLVANACSAQGAAKSASDDEILHALLPNGTWADPEQLARFKRQDEIRALKAAQGTAKDGRALSIVWLLAVLKYHYAENRGRLIQIERSCDRRTYPENGQCYSIIADPLIDLFKRGDHALLPVTFDIEPHSDGFLSELLAGFFSDTLATQPRVFLKALARRPLKEQKAIAMLAGFEDGGGMDPERLRAVQGILRRIILSRRDPLSQVARTCLKQINIANKRDTDHDEND